MIDEISSVYFSATFIFVLFTSRLLLGTSSQLCQTFSMLRVMMVVYSYSLFPLAFIWHHPCVLKALEGGLDWCKVSCFNRIERIRLLCGKSISTYCQNECILGSKIITSAAP